MAEQKNINEAIGDIMHEWFTERVTAMQDTLAAFKIVNGSSILPNDIAVPETNPTATGIKAELLLPDYYEFVDEGVKGIGNLKAGWTAAKNTGRFSFKTEYISKGMIDNLKEWRARKGLGVDDKPKDKVKKVKRAITATSATGVRGSAKGVKVDKFTLVAILTAKKIKRTGLRQTLFFTDNFKEEHLRVLEKRIVDATGLAFELKMDVEEKAVRVVG